MSDAAAELGAQLLHLSGWSFVVDRPKVLGVAVSGGGDSMALLDLMAAHGAALGFAVKAVTVDHGLRSEVAGEIETVRAFCAERGITHDVLTWEGWDGSGNLQALAREARYGLIGDWARRLEVDWIALGHTEDDQAETVMMRLARAAGVDGLAGMPDRFEREGLVMIRPLLSIGRLALRDYLRGRGIRWCEDPSNSDESFERVRMRKALADLSELGIDAAALSTVARNMSAAKFALNHYAFREATERSAALEDQGDVILPERMTPSNQVPHEVLRRLLVSAILWVNGGWYPPRASALADMDAAMSTTDTHTLAGCVISRQTGKAGSDAKLRITREFNAVKDHVTGTDALWDGRWALTGPHAPGLEVRALGAAIKDTAWRETGVPRASLMASPAIWHGDQLVAAPVAGLENGWSASATGRGSFAHFLLSR